MPPNIDEFDSGLLAEWCLKHLGSSPAEELFRSGHLSAVVGVRLADGRETVVKIRPASPRIAACVDVQRRMFLAGYPCPEPLGDPMPFGTDVATAEAYVPGGSMFPTSDTVVASAEAFAWLMRLTPGPGEVGTLDPPPSWADWNRRGESLWPWPEGHKVNLNEAVGADWIDDAGHRARERLRTTDSEPVIGHCDWLAGNLRWSGDRLLVVHDWDSVIADNEAVLVGFAAALFSTHDANQLATIEETERFLAAYCHARGRAFTTDELQQSWAAGVWTRANDAKYQHAVREPITSLSEREADERLRRAGANEQ